VVLFLEELEFYQQNKENIMAKLSLIVNGKAYEYEEGDETVEVEGEPYNIPKDTSTEEINQLSAQVSRAKRNAMLIDSDWTQNKDVVLSNDAEWKTYRQALRDLTKHSSFPNLQDSDFPTKPS
tara:strand:+ start:485 stop:853 length:369 start_codon:yes stop_codon:yes gene_type:complete